MNKAIKLYKDSTIKRYDDDKILHYFKTSDFSGLKAEEFSFINQSNVTLNGYFYHYENYDHNKLIIFCHGIGPGHMAYMQEINKLCKEGYMVLAYDNTGCGISLGDNIRGLSQSLADLDDCLNLLKSDDKYNKKEIICIGHSWGGYAVSNILNYHPEIKKIIAISGFTSFKQMMKQSLKGIQRIALPSLINYEKKVNPKYVNSSSIAAINNHDSKVLWFHSLDDGMVQYNYSAKLLNKKIKNKNFILVTSENKKHNPNYSLDAVNYMNEVFKDYIEKCKNKTLNTFNEKQEYMNKVSFERMTVQDEEVFNQIFEFIKK